MIDFTNVCFGFDRRIGLYSDINYILDIYKASMTTFCDVGKSGVTPKLYADTETLQYLKGYYGEGKGIDISNKTFTHVDDLKVYIHSNEDLNCITIDGDILFQDTLRFPNQLNTKVYFEIEETEARSLHPKYDKNNGYETLRRVFKKHNVADFVKDYDYKNTSAYNVGILKFQCQKTKDLLIERYYDIRKYFDNVIAGDEEIESWHIPSIMLTQYYWGSICKKNKIDVTFLKDFNQYTHLYGKWKHAQGVPERIYEIIKSKNKTKLI